MSGSPGLGWWNNFGFPRIYSPAGVSEAPCIPAPLPGAFTAAQLQQMIVEAQTALHALMTGQSIVSFQDQNGERVQYAAGDRNQLTQYISGLQQQLADLTNPIRGLPKRPGPIGFIF